MASLLPESRVVGGAIPPPPSFAEFKFTTIGQEPQLLKRISAPTSDFQYHERSSPSPSMLAELEYPSRPVSPKPLSRPSLLQSLTQADTSTDVVMSNEVMIGNTSSTQTQSGSLKNIRPMELLTAPSVQLPPPFRPALCLNQDIVSTPAPSPPQREPSSISTSSSEISKTPASIVVPAAVVTSTPLEGRYQSPILGGSISTYEGDSPYTALRALQARFLSALSNLRPPNTTEALLLVQAANSHSANALSTAHCSHTLAQQSLASAREAVTAAQECLSAAEQAKAHASDAVAAVEQLSSGNIGSEVAGNIEWEWKSTITQLQDDLRALGEWVGEREGEEALKRREADTLAQERKNKETMEAAMSLTRIEGLDPHLVRAMSMEVSRKAAAEEARVNAVQLRVLQPPSQMRPPHSRSPELQRSAEFEADAAMRAWSVEHDRTTKYVPTTPTAAVDSGETLALERRDDDQPLRSLHREEEARLQAQREEENRVRELHERKLEVAKFQMLERERVEAEERSGRAAEESRLKLKSGVALRVNKEADGHQNRQAKGSIVVEDARRALEAHKEKERALAEQRRLADEESKKAAEAQRLEQAKRAETRRLLEERKERELEELKKRQAEAAAELECQAEARELELFAEQGRRRQEVMAQKQRASAETAARINAERAREKEQSTSASPISPGPTVSHLQQSVSDHPVQYGNLVAKKTMTSGPSKKPRSLSGGVQLGATEVDQPNTTTPESLSPSPSLARSAALGLRITKPTSQTVPLPSAKRQATSSEPKADPTTNVDGFKTSLSADRPRSRKPQSTASTATPPAPRYFTPTNALNEYEDLCVHRRSEDSGNICVVPPSQVPPASPEAQAANLRFVKDTNGVLWDTYLKPITHPANVKQEPLSDGPSAPNKEERPSTAPRVLKGNRVDADPPSSSIPPPGLKIPLPNKPYPLPPIPKAKLPNFQKMKEARTASEQLPNITPITIAPSSKIIPPPLPTAPTPTVTVVVSPTVQTLNKAVNLRRPPPSFPNSTQTSSQNAPRDDSTLPAKAGIISLPLPQLPAPSNTRSASPSSRLAGTSRLSDPTQFEDPSEIAPTIQHDGGWDRPSTSAHEEGYGNATQSEKFARPRPGRQRYRGSGEHYSPAPQSPTATYPPSRPLPSQDIRPMGGSRQLRPAAEIPIPPRSPVLGKRRYREDSRLDEPPARRHWQPEADRDREEQMYMSRSVWPPPPARDWRSPSPERPALQSRIGVRNTEVYTIGLSQSYRPTYAEDTYGRPPSRNSDNYSTVGDPEYSTSYGQSTSSYTPPGDRYTLGRHQVTDTRMERVPSSGRGRGNSNPSNSNAIRGAYRGRGRGGGRPLNLEQRISSHKPITLMHRLESPPRNF